MKHWADGGETSLRNTVLLCRRHHRTVHEGRVKVGTSPDGTVLFFTRKGRVLADAPKRPGWPDAPNGRVQADASNERARADTPGRGVRAVSSLPPVPLATRATLSNGAALYRDSTIPWAIEAAARDAVEESLDADP